MLNDLSIFQYAFLLFDIDEEAGGEGQVGC
jgi:hypothetical protein